MSYASRTKHKIYLSFPPDPDNADLSLLAVDETVMEALEDNSLQLQNLQSSKYVQGNSDFLEKVQNWQKKLGMVDVVLSTWREVQGKWQNLQSISQQRPCATWP